MATVQQFDPARWAQRYAHEQRANDPGVEATFYLPVHAGDREIRFVVVNSMIGERTDDAPLEPIEFGVDRGSDTQHQLLILDVTPAQWDRIQRGALALPADWSLDHMVSFTQ
jgi:hypothetical protein